MTTCFFVKKEELSNEFSSSHMADSSSTFAYLDYIMNFLKVNVRDLALAKYEDTHVLINNNKMSMFYSSTAQRNIYAILLE